MIVSKGTAVITATRAADNNYNQATASYILTVGDLAKTNDTLAFDGVTNDAVAKTFGEGNFTLAATGGAGTGDITYASNTEGTATVGEMSGEVTIKGAGTAIITATRAEDATYNQVTVSYILTVAKADDALTFATMVTNTAVTIEMNGSASVDYAAGLMFTRAGNNDEHNGNHHLQSID